MEADSFFVNPARHQKSLVLWQADVALVSAVGISIARN